METTWITTAGDIIFDVMGNLTTAITENALLSVFAVMSIIGGVIYLFKRARG
ncbi:MAG: hypothetical protein PHT03_08070 [Bacilli bacterium]|nr:hypothetical protein [Bacilli bacterium]